MSLLFERLPEMGRNGELHRVLNQHAEALESLRPVASLNMLTGHRKDGVWREGLESAGEGSTSSSGTVIQVERFTVRSDEGDYLVCKRWSDFLARGDAATSVNVAKPAMIRRSGWDGKSAANTGYERIPYPGYDPAPRYVFVNRLKAFQGGLNGWEVQEEQQPDFVLPGEVTEEIYAIRITPEGSSEAFRRISSVEVAVVGSSVPLFCDWIDLNVDPKLWRLVGGYHQVTMKMDDGTGNLVDRALTVWSGSNIG